MTEAGSGSGRAEMERRLVQRSMEDESFRQKLLDDPEATIERELGFRLPEGVEVRVVEESADTIYLVLPSVSPLGQGEELSDRQLEEVAGGWERVSTEGGCVTMPPATCSTCMPPGEEC
jgi:hypothetical protein